MRPLTRLPHLPLTALAAALATTTLLAACGGGGGGSTTPNTSTTSTGQTSATSPSGSTPSTPTPNTAANLTVSNFTDDGGNPIPGNYCGFNVPPLNKSLSSINTITGQCTIAGNVYAAFGSLAIASNYDMIATLQLQSYPSFTMYGDIPINGGTVKGSWLDQAGQIYSTNGTTGSAGGLVINFNPNSN